MTVGVAETAVERALAFIGQLTLPDDRPLGSTFSSDPWLLKVLTLALATTEAGRPEYPQLWVELARGCAKTTVAAAVSLVEALAVPLTHIIAIAADEQQARILLEAVAGLIRRSPRLTGLIQQTRNEFRFPNRSFVRIMSSDTASFFGIGAAAKRVIIIADEVGQWATPNLWYAAVSTLAKHEGNRLLALTNAGIANSWQQDARAAVEAAGGRVYAVPGCPASWITEERLEQMRASLPAPIFRRYYMNEWVQEIGTAIDMADWDRCYGPDLPPLDASTPCVAAVDAGISGDCFAIVTVSRGGEKSESQVVDTGRGFSLLLPAKVLEPEVWVRDCAVWKPDGRAIDFNEPRDYLARLAREHRLVEITYDPFQLWDFMHEFQAAHGVWCVPFDQGSARARADSDLLRLIRSGRLKHSGDVQLREHIANCGFKVSPNEDSKGRLVRHGKGKIDAAVALSMSAYQCLRLLI